MCVYIWMHVKWSCSWEWLLCAGFSLLQNAVVATWTMCVVEKYSSLAGREERQREKEGARDGGKERERREWGMERRNNELGELLLSLSFSLSFSLFLYLSLHTTAVSSCYLWATHDVMPIHCIKKINSWYSCLGLRCAQIQWSSFALTRRDDHLYINQCWFSFVLGV